jgi:putative membrane protein
MELNMILWAFYLLLMFCYDKNFLGDHHPVTYLIGISCFIGSLFMFRRQLHIAAWGANIRMAVATVIVFWTPVEILGRINFFKEFWVHPQEYRIPLLFILGAFILLLGYMWLKGAKKKRITSK